MMVVKEEVVEVEAAGEDDDAPFCRPRRSWADGGNAARTLLANISAPRPCYLPTTCGRRPGDDEAAAAYQAVTDCSWAEKEMAR